MGTTTVAAGNGTSQNAGGAANVQVGALAASAVAAPNATAVQTALSGKADTGHAHPLSVITGVKTINGQSLAGTGDIVIAGGAGAAAQNSLAPASTTLSPSVDAVNAGLALKADYLAPGIITAATTLIRSPTGGATNGFNRVQYCSVTVATTVTATGAQALVGDFITLDNSNPASTAAITLAGVTARSGYTLVAQPGTIVEALCVAAGSFQAATLIPVVGGAVAALISALDQPSFALSPNVMSGAAPAGLGNLGIQFSTNGTAASRTKTVGVLGNMPKAGFDGASAANSLAGIETGGALLFDATPFVFVCTFAVADSLGLGAKTAVGFAYNSQSTAAGLDASATYQQSKLLFASGPTDAQFKFFSNDSATVSPTSAVLNGGTGFACNDPTQAYKIRIEYFPTGPRRIIYTLTNIIGGAVATNTISTASQMPLNSELVVLQINRSSGALVGAAKIDIMGALAGAYV